MNRKDYKYIISTQDFIKAFKDDPYVIEILEREIKKSNKYKDYCKKEITSITKRITESTYPVAKSKDEYTFYVYLGYLLNKNAFDAYDEINRNLIRQQRDLLLLKSGNYKSQETYHIRIETVNSKDILIVCDNLGIQYKQSGNRYVALCPIHNDKHPSFTIYPDSNSFYCFGCNVGGNNINLVEQVNGCDFKEAMQFLFNI